MQEQCSTQAPCRPSRPPARRSPVGVEQPNGGEGSPMNLRAWFKRTKPSNTDPAVITTETATGHHDPAFVRRFFNGASTEALELA